MRHQHLQKLKWQHVSYGDGNVEVFIYREIQKKHHPNTEIVISRKGVNIFAPDFLIDLPRKLLIVQPTPFATSTSKFDFRQATAY